MAYIITSLNLHFFLNETCKNVMNITDLVDSLQLQLSNLENIRDFGYIEHISNIIIQYVGCKRERTDKKRETMYIKDENKWEKDL